MDLVLAKTLLILLMKTQVRQTPLFLQQPFPLLRETVKLSPLLTILVHPLLVNAQLLLFLLVLPSLRHSLPFSLLSLKLLLINLLLPL
jgi:hypothetical protein